MSDKRELNTCQHRFKKDLKCFTCGQYSYKSQAFKTNKYASPFHFNFQHYLKSLRKTASKTLEPIQMSEQTYQLLTSICDKFLFSTETLALGLYIYQLLHKLNTCQPFWASAALIVAGKAVQLDKNVPYLNRYQRYAQKSFSQQDYQQAQRTIFEAMNFEVHHSTFITFIDFYLTCGVIFKEDKLNNTLVQFFEDDVCTRAKDFLRKGTFNKHHPQVLALGIIKEIRNKYNLQKWNGHLQQLTGYTEDDIPTVSTEDSLKEISGNKRIKLAELKASSRNKYQNIIRHQKQPTIQKYSSISKSITLKENCYSSSKQLQPTNSRKQSHHLVVLQSLNQDYTRRR